MTEAGTGTLARVLAIAGSDSSGGAGIQADIKTITALGGYAMTAITAVTAQNTQGVFGIAHVTPELVALQIELVLGDLGADAVKIGMLGTAAIIEVVVDVLGARARRLPLVVDPVMLAKGGQPLLEPDAVKVLKERLLPMAALVTPNAPEAEVLTGVSVQSVRDLEHAAERLLLLGPAAVLVKGGHLEGDTVTDLLRTADGHSERFTSPRQSTRSTHGTGCTLASAIATGIAQGLTLRHAVDRARSYVQEAIRTAPGLGHGAGPLFHGHTVQAFGLGPNVT
jgi:hydroxymethylpyrimidine/phosphomethylpyrimidine kinase